MTIMFNEGHYSFPPHYYWLFNGSTDDTISIQPKDSGMLISSDSLIQTCVNTEDVSFDNEGKYISVAENLHNFKMTAVAPVFISFDENNEPELLIDPDEDGSFDTPVEVGDVNCDGKS